MKRAATIAPRQSLPRVKLVGTRSEGMLRRPAESISCGVIRASGEKTGLGGTQCERLRTMHCRNRTKAFIVDILIPEWGHMHADF